MNPVKKYWYDLNSTPPKNYIWVKKDGKYKWSTLENKWVLIKDSNSANAQEPMVETTYSELKNLRDSGKLVPGVMYRITDYQCTTAQEGTRSAGHQFDVIVQAISESVLSEDAKAVQHKFEIPEEAYNVTGETDLIHFGQEEYQGVVYQRYTTLDMDLINGYYLIDFNNINDANPEQGYESTIYCKYYVVDGEYLNGQDEGEVVAFKQNVHELFYFSNSNLAAWKLKYCLDNDTNRFAWARTEAQLSPVSHQKILNVFGSEGLYKYIRYSEKDSENGYAWVYDTAGDNLTIQKYITYGREDLEDTTDLIYTASENVSVGDILDMSGTNVTVVEVSQPEGKGVIYQMIDEYGNDCPYDFKNIMFIRELANYRDWILGMFGEATSINPYFYTFSWINEDLSIDDTSVVGKMDDEGILQYAKNNTIKSVSIRIPNNELLRLNNIILVSSWHYDDTFYYDTDNNMFSYQSSDCTLGGIFHDNVFDTGFQQNVLLGQIEKNKSFGIVTGFEYNENIANKIIYNSTGDTIEMKDINDAFSGT